MEDIQAIVDKYFDSHPIDVEQVKINYQTRNRIKLLDDSTTDAYTLGVDLAKLYMKKLMIK